MKRQVIPRTHCYRGHEWTTTNEIWIKDSRAPGGRRRQCRECKNAARRAWNKLKTLAVHGELCATERT